ncbi:N-acetylneuraminate synthase family protein [Ramlibacter albus]|uniref:N-acetylneuraminate synthase family protein n=1 Tax=Ramlibacter albus TaxID=2079448 RepID=A0A923M470_9BURK|nr:N-acetylneuraminate synthase family protein [Ramlibacter albus]MBC5763635.1 N-acetylneuraminate synthase family protein [Ramlibacter albus]
MTTTDSKTRRASIFTRPLFVFEMANNHMGDVEHGVRIVETYAAIAAQFPEFDCAIKFQYRDLDTFVHSSAKGDHTIKLVKRFEETRLDAGQFERMRTRARQLGLLVMCTPFDEVSVERVENEGYDILKIASCSLTDWPLLERAVRTQLPLVVSTGGATKEEVDRVALFLTNREKRFALMHCVAEYPTPDDDLRLGRIAELAKAYPQAIIGYSTHEEPSATLPVMMAIATGARVFEKHIGLEAGSYKLNAYSASPEQTKAWLSAAREAVKMKGPAGWPAPSAAELASLRELRRGVWTRRAVRKGEVLSADSVEFAFPPKPGQYLANDWSKYAVFRAQRDIAPGEPVDAAAVTREDLLGQLRQIALRVDDLLRDAGVAAPPGQPLEISHHYGIAEYARTGLAMVTVVNREYCKKILVMFKGQEHPEQYHLKKEETFLMVSGELETWIDGQPRVLKRGDVLTVQREQRHRFVALTDVIFEEISTNHDKADSYYTDPAIAANTARKSFLNFWHEPRTA